MLWLGFYQFEQLSIFWITTSSIRTNSLSMLKDKFQLGYLGWMWNGRMLLFGIPEIALFFLALKNIRINCFKICILFVAPIHLYFSLAWQPFEITLLHSIFYSEQFWSLLFSALALLRNLSVNTLTGDYEFIF